MSGGYSAAHAPVVKSKPPHESVAAGPQRSICSTAAISVARLVGFALVGVLHGHFGDRARLQIDGMREFAIRMALGESRDRILRGVLLRAGWRVLAGVTLGFGTAFGASRGIRALLVGVAPEDGLTYAMVLVLVIAVAAAAYVPGRRAAAADPRTRLRQG